MVWYGMVWYGMVCNGMVWYGMVSVEGQSLLRREYPDLLQSWVGVEQELELKKVNFDRIRGFGKFSLFFQPILGLGAVAAVGGVALSMNQCPARWPCRVWFSI